MKNYPRINFEEITPDVFSGESEIKEKPIGAKVFRNLVVAFGIFCVIVFARLFSLGVADGDFYRARAEANVSQIFVERAPRGIIYDRYGEILAENRDSINLYVRSSELARDNEMEAAEALYTAVFGGDENEFKTILTEKNLQLGNFIPFKSGLTKEQAIKIESSGLKSLFVNVDSTRFFDPAFSHIVGYSGLTNREEVKGGLSNVDIIGRSGVEAEYDNLLRGENGRLITYRNVQGVPVGEQEVNKAIPGQDLVTTIDAKLQKYFYEALTERMRQLGRSRGVGIAIDPRNGELLALISVPSFSPDKISEALASPDNSLFNRAIAGLYSPGSTIKPMIAVAALVEKIIRPEDLILSTGYIEIPNPYYPDQPSRFVDWKPQGWVNIYSALARSCNVYFYTVGGGYGEIAGLGVKNLKKYFGIFGLNNVTEIDLPGEKKGNADSLGSGKSWTIGDTYHISIGQGDILVTPLELLNAIASIANGGFLRRITLTPRNEPELLADLSEFAPEMKEVVKGMEDGVYESYGTAYSLHDLPLKIAAKTGTAQIENNARINALFVGCAPMESASPPRICLLVLVEDAKEGSSNTLPVAYQVFKWYAENRLK